MKGLRNILLTILLSLALVSCYTRIVSISQETNEYSFLIPKTAISKQGVVAEQILYRKGYVTSYNKNTKIPNWVAWHLMASHIDGQIKRPGNAWHEDTDVPQPRATLEDYRGSG